MTQNLSENSGHEESNSFFRTPCALILFSITRFSMSLHFALKKFGEEGNRKKKNYKVAQ